jgi:glycosyl transferase family 90
MYLDTYKAIKTTLTFLCVFHFIFISQVNANHKPDKIIFRTLLETNHPSWMEEQIQNDLQPYKVGITQEMLDRVMSSPESAPNLLVRFKVNDGQLSFFHNMGPSLYGQGVRLNSYIQALNFLIEAVGLPNLDFILTLNDYNNFPNTHFPIMAYGKNDHISKDIMMPDFIALNDYTMGLGNNKVSDPLWEQYPWELKEKKAFWRGATTGGYFKSDNWFSFPRTQLALFSLQRPDLLDAKITSVVQAESDVFQILADHHLLGNFVSISDHLNYRYLIDVDGNGWTVPRCFWVLLSNSLLLKQTSEWVLWYSKGLIPFKHYIPVTSEASDIFEKIEWAINHDDEAKQISMEATRFARNDLSLESTYMYFYKVLIEYAKIQNLCNKSKDPRLGGSTSNKNRKSISNYFWNLLSNSY